MQRDGIRQDKHTNGDTTTNTVMVLLLPNEAPKSTQEWTSISDRIIAARFWFKYIKTTIIQIYAPPTMQTERT